MIDIEKERVAFEEWYENAIGRSLVYKTHDKCYLNSKTQEAWETWQAAKAQAMAEVLKKFCNEHKDPAWRGRLTEYDKGYSDCCIAVLEMIEAQLLQ